MLKLAYSDIGIHLEHLSSDITQVIAQRRLLAHRMGHVLHLEPSYAAMVIPDESSPEMKRLEFAIATSNEENISLCASLANGIEVILQGYWLAHNTSATEGLFLTALQPSIEWELTRIWDSVGAQMISCTWPTGGSLSELGYEF